MNYTRVQFKNALAFCKRNKMEILKNNLVSKFKSNDKVNFWNEVRKINGKPSFYNSSCIDDKTDSHEIIRIFDEKYSVVLNDPLSQVIAETEAESGNNSLNPCDPNLLVSRRRLDTAIDLLKTGLGHDDIHSDHLKFSGNKFRNLLRRFFVKCLTHNFLPHNMLLAEIRPRESQMFLSNSLMLCIVNLII